MNPFGFLGINRLLANLHALILEGLLLEIGGSSNYIARVANGMDSSNEMGGKRSWSAQSSPRASSEDRRSGRVF